MVKKIVGVLALFVILFLPGTSGSLSSALMDSLRGRFLIQTEANNEAWYADPTTDTIYYLGQAEDALYLMQELGLGISNANLDSLKGEGVHHGVLNEELSQQLSGHILLQVEDQGQPWYVWPENNERYYLGDASSVARSFTKLGLGISQETFQTLTFSKAYLISKETLALAERAVASETSGVQDKEVLEAMAANRLRKITDGNETVIAFELSSPLSTSNYGYLERGNHYAIVGGDFLSRSEYLASDIYLRLEASKDAQDLIDEVLEIQIALNFYHSDVNGYPLSNKEGDRIGTTGKTLITNPNGFYGTVKDPVVYHEINLPIENTVLTYYSDGLDYAITFTTLAKTEFFEAGKYTLTKNGIVAGHKAADKFKGEEVLCPLEFVPVCGVDGVTYSNKCQLDQAEIALASEGACKK